MFRRRQRAVKRAHRHGAGAGRHRRPEDRRRLPEAAQPRRPRSGSATRAGRTTARSSKAGFTVETYPYYDAANARPRLRRHADRAEARPPARSSCCTPAATTRPATTSARAVGPGGSPPSRRASWSPSSTWPTRASARASPRTARWSSQFVASARTSSSRARSPRAFALYGERVGALCVLCQNKEEAARVLSQLKIVIRTNYSNPPTHGSQVVATVLTTPEAARPVGAGAGGDARAHQADAQGAGGKAQGAGVGSDFSFITQQRGMFTYSGLTKDQMVRLREEFGVYGIDTGRICVAALNTRNIDYVADAIAKVVQCAPPGRVAVIGGGPAGPGWPPRCWPRAAPPSMCSTACRPWAASSCWPAGRPQPPPRAEATGETSFLLQRYGEAQRGCCATRSPRSTALRFARGPPAWASRPSSAPPAASFPPT